MKDSKALEICSKLFDREEISDTEYEWSFNISLDDYEQDDLIVELLTALQPTNIDNEVIQFVELNVEQALNDLFAYEKGNKEKYYGVWNFLGDLQSITNKALTTPSVSPSHGIKEVQLTELEEK